MEELVVVILPDVMTWLSGYIAAVFGFFSAGILVAFFFWTIPFVVDAVFTILRREGGL